MEKDNTYPKIVNFSGDILSPYLVDGCRFEKQEENKKEVNFCVVNFNQPHSHVSSHEKTVPTVQLLNGYWLYCGFVFYKKNKNSKRLKHFSLHFFDDIRPLFRAEWASNDIPESNNHAQPHWHLDAKTVLDSSVGDSGIMGSFEDYQMSKAGYQPHIADLGRAHFFMNWNLEREKECYAPYLDFCDESTFKQWLTKTMKYVDAELRALTKR